MEGKLIMIQMMASMQKEPQLVDDAINALQQYKINDYPEGDYPFMELMLLVIKWEQGNNANPIEVIQKGIRDEEIIKEAKSMRDKEDIREKLDTHSIILGKSGKA